MLAVRSMSVPYRCPHRGPRAEGHVRTWTNVHGARDPRPPRAAAGSVAQSVEPDGTGSVVGGADRADRCEVADPVGQAEAGGRFGILELGASDAEELGVGDGAGGTRREACEVGHGGWISRAGRRRCDGPAIGRLVGSPYPLLRGSCIPRKDHRVRDSRRRAPAVPATL
jgi:hypothetical protein